MRGRTDDGRTARVLLMAGHVTFSRRELVAVAAVAGGLVASTTWVLPYASLGFARYALPKEVVFHLAAAVAVCALAGRSRPRLDRADWLLVVVAVLGCVSAALATNAWMASRGATLMTSAAALFIAVRSLEWRTGRRLILAGALVAAAFAALVIILESQGWFLGLSMPGRSPGGVFGNRNFGAHFLVLAAPVGLWVCAVGRRRQWLVGLGFLAVVAWAVVLTRSRGAWLGLAAALSIWTLLSSRMPGARTRIPAALGALVVGAALALLLPNALTWSSGYGATAKGLLDYESGTGRGRVIQYVNTARMAADHPLLGVGPGNWSVAYPEYASERDPSYQPNGATPVNRLPNTDWLGLASERGLVASGLLLAFGVAVARGAWRRRWNGGIWVLSMLGGLLVMGCVDAVILQPAPLMLVAVLVGIGHPREAEPVVGATPSRSWWLAPALAASLAGAVQAGAAIHGNLLARVARSPEAMEVATRYRPDSYVFHWRVARGLRARGDCQGAADWARRALELYPHHEASRRTVERCVDRLSSAPGKEERP